MKKYERINLLMDTTMRLVARRSLVGLSMRMVSDHSGVNQSMIYKDFGSKEGLLRMCFMQESERISKLVGESLHKAMAPGGEINTKTLHDFWHEIVPKFVEEGDRMLYYYEYKEHASSFYVHEEQWLYNATDENYQDFVVNHLVDAAIHYAKRIIRNDEPDSEEKRDMVWNLLSDGLGNMI